MNVLQLCTKVPYPPKDGGSLAINAFTGLFRQCNFNVTVLAANTPKHFQAVSTTQLFGVRLLSVPVDTNLRLWSLAKNYLFSDLPYQVTRFRCHEFAGRLRELLIENAFDIIQLEGSHMGIYLPEIRKYSTAKVVLRAHNIEHHIWKELAKEEILFFRRYYLKIMAERFRKFEHRIMREVDAVIPITEYDKVQIELFAHPQKCNVIPSGISVGEYTPQPGATADSIFYIGALDWIPNQSGLLWFLDNVWPVLTKKSPGISFHIAGRNTPLWLKRRLLAENVYFYGEIDDAIEFMNRFQLMVVPLFSGSGVRIKILEAMALKKAVVTTPKGSEGLNVTSGKELCIANDANAFVNEIIHLLKDKNFLLSIGNEARDYIANEFDNLALASKVEDIYQSILH